MKFEFDTDEIANDVVEEVLNRKIDGKTIRQWMNEIKNGQWVSVKDRLPKKKGDYIIYNTDGIVWPYWYDADDNSWYDSCGYKTDIVTHWMPLPSAEGLNEA